MQDVTLDLASWNRFLTRDLLIAPDLVGSIHKFTFGGREVKIALPSANYLPVEPGFYTEPGREKLLAFNSWRESNGKKIPSKYWVHAVDITVSLSTPISVPEGILGRPPNAREIVPESKQKELEQLVMENKLIAERVFDLWRRVLRWKSDNSAIGRPVVLGHESGWGTYLVTESSGQRIWIGTGYGQVPGGETITPEVWKAAESALQDGHAPPVYIELMFDAIEHMKLGDLQRAVVDMAVACETYLRELVASSLPVGISSAIRIFVDEASIRSVLKKFIPELLDREEKKQFQKIKSILHKLFDARNGVLHGGRVDNLAVADCQKYLEVTRILLRLRAYTP